MKAAEKSKKILFVVNTVEFFLSHRLPIAVAARSAGIEVHVASARGAEICKIEEYGFIYHEIPFVRSGQNPFVEAKTVFRLFSLFRSIKPDLVHLITIKPVLYGGVAARFAKVKGVVAAVSGLGTVFLANTLFGRFRRRLVVTLYRVALKQTRLSVIFQNPDDRKLLLDIRACQSNQAHMIRGSGVALEQYPYLPEPNGKPVIVMAARLLKDKGVLEYVDAIRQLKRRGVELDARMIGSPDIGNPTSVSSIEIQAWSDEGVVAPLGFRSDIANQYAQANIVCLPSYREGLPKCLVEAAACGRAVVTTDVAGCRDAITPSITGVLVPPRDSEALADAIQQLINNPTQRRKMGRAGRQLAEEAFTIETIVSQHMKIYQDILNEC